MAPKKVAVTSKALQSLLISIGSASSGTKRTLLARFQRDVQRPGFPNHQTESGAKRRSTGSQKLRIMSIDMGIKNLAFCDAEVSHTAAGSGDRRDFNAHMNILRWKKLDLVDSTYPKSSRTASEDETEAAGVPDADSDLYSPSVLSKTAYQLIVEEVLSANPNVILIEKQRWRSGGGSAVQQWTLRVNTLEAMLWAVLETLRHVSRPHTDQGTSVEKHSYHVHAVDPKRVGQYWLGQHARALQERDEQDSAFDVAPLSKGAGEPEDTGEDALNTKTAKKPSRTKAEKSAKIAILRSWLAHDTSSTTPSTPSQMPSITFSIAPSAAFTRDALLPQTKIPRRRKTAKTTGKDAGLDNTMPVTEIKKLDDITDCFLQAAAWVAWESNRMQLLAVGGDDEPTKLVPVDEERILEMVRECGDCDE
ncbi:hypothetical protein SVAN01_09285 [Stagonosporopsis vannaccii]|nr:hypothetical protein SVAN01_09285 [Stagonosporopsis vannaccii]